MSNVNMIIEERPAEIGNFLVGRLLPFKNKRMVGPFSFIDHMGPTHLIDYENFDVGPHPHIGLSTLTYLFEGAIMHRDSLGNEVEITPGQVNWMTAGKGIVHSERTPEHLRHTDKDLHGLQIWVALPRELEEMEPNFYHIEADQVPAWTSEGLEYKLIAGEAFGKKSPVPVYSPLFFIEIKSKERQSVQIGKHLFGEAALYILEGKLKIEGHTHEAKHLLVAQNSQLCEFVMEANTTVYLFGGEPFPEGRQIFWNFVASSPELIERAKKNWREQNFPTIAGETGYIPLPEPLTGLNVKKD